MARIYQDNEDSLSIAEQLANSGSLSISDNMDFNDSLESEVTYEIDLSDDTSMADVISNKPDKVITDSVDIVAEDLVEDFVLGAILDDSLSIAESMEYVSEFKLGLSDELVITERVIDYDEEIEVEWAFVKYYAAVHAGI